MIHFSNESSHFKTVSYIHFDDTLPITSMPNHSNGKSQLCKITKITTMPNHQNAISQVCQIYKILNHKYAKSQLCQITKITTMPNY